MRAAVYTRISSDPTGEQLGVTRQLEDCEGLAERLCWEIVARFDDNDISAYDGTKRPGFEAVLAAMKRNEFDTLICWHPDRLYRSLKDLERLIDIAEERGINIRSVNGGDLDLSNATGKMLARIVGSVSRAESEHKAERQRRANIQRAEAGGWWSSHRVFGYTQDGKLMPREAKLVRQAADDVLAGKTLTAVARQWNEAGVLSTRGAKWNVPRIKRLLVNPRYAGLRTYKGKIVGPGAWTAIIDPETHAGLSAMLRDPSRGTNVSWERRYLGSFRYVCGRCEAVMKHAISTHSDGSCYHRYTCTARAHLSRTQADLDDYVERVALQHMRDSQKLKKALAAAKGKTGAGPDELRVRRTALQAQKDELAALFTDGVLDGPAVRRESAKLTMKISEVDAALAELVRKSPLAELLSDGVEKLDKRWAAASADIKGKIIDELFTVVVNPAPKGSHFRPEYIEFRPRA
jgi:DNA invertase Pin-like site-specific DNA recombinase